MLDLNLIRRQPELVKDALKKRNVVFDLGRLLKLDEKYREMLAEAEGFRAQKNKATEALRELVGKEKEKLLKQMKAVDKKEDVLNKKLETIKGELDALLLELPNIPKADVPVGRDERDSKVVKTWGKPPIFDFQAKDYLTLGEKLDLIDTERATKISGSRFGYLKNQAVLLEFALLQYALDVILKKGFVLLNIPLLVKKDVMEGTGYSSYATGQEAYWIEKDQLFLVGTGEHSLVTYHKDEILDGNKLPLRYTTFSPCFRREAGSYGRDTKGILRVHQFDKLEMVSLTSPEKSDEEFEFLLGIQEQLVQGLKLPYHLLSTCTGDLPKPSAKVIDLECFIPSEGRYRETHSVSNCTDFQTRRLNIRYKKSKIQNLKSKIEYVHALNGTAFAMGRIMIAIMENYQTKEGTIKVPEALQPYLGMDKIARQQDSKTTR